MKTLYKITSLPLTLLFCSSFFLLAGCGTTSPWKLSTPSGRPEVIIQNSSPQSAMDGVAAWLASQGKPISETGVYTICSNFKQGGFWRWRNPVYRTVYTVVPEGANAILYGTTYDEGTAEGATEEELTKQSDYEDMQKQLTQIAEFIKTRLSSEITK